MSHKRSLDKSPMRPSRLLALALMVGLFGASLVVADTDDKNEKPRPKAKAAEQAKPAASTDGVMMRPKAVDGTVSAYTGAVRKTDPNAKVYTNDDLEKMWAGQHGPWATQATPEAGDSAAPGETTPSGTSLEWMDQQTARVAARAKAIAEAESALAAANSDVANLEKQLLAVKNPFSARPQLSDEEKSTRAKGESAMQRLERAQEQLDLARERAQAAQARLNQVRR